MTGRRYAEVGPIAPLLGREIKRWWGDDGGDLLLTRLRPGRRRCLGPGDCDPSQLA